MKEEQRDVKLIIESFYSKGRAFEKLGQYIEEVLDRSSDTGKVVCRTFNENYPAVFCLKAKDGKFNFLASARYQDPKYIELGVFDGRDVLDAIKEFVQQEELEAKRLGKWYGRKEDSPNLCMR